MTKPEPSPSDHDRLLADTYHADWDAGAPSALAARAARSVRRRRTLRQSSSAVGIVMLVGGAWWFSFSSERQKSEPVRNYEIISDVELMACLKDQSVMILNGPNGPKEVIWLDELVY